MAQCKGQCSENLWSLECSFIYDLYVASNNGLSNRHGIDDVGLQQNRLRPILGSGNRPSAQLRPPALAPAGGAGMLSDLSFAVSNILNRVEREPQVYGIDIITHYPALRGRHKRMKYEMCCFSEANSNGPPCSTLALLLPLEGLGPDFLIWSCLSFEAAIGRFSANGMSVRPLPFGALPSLLPLPSPNRHSGRPVPPVFEEEQAGAEQPTLHGNRLNQAAWRSPAWR